MLPDVGKPVPWLVLKASSIPDQTNVHTIVQKRPVNDFCLCVHYYRELPDELHKIGLYLKLRENVNSSHHKIELRYIDDENGLLAPLR